MTDIQNVNMRFVTLEGKEYDFNKSTEQIFYADQVDRLIGFYKWERGTDSEKFALECIAETYLQIDNSNVKIGQEAQRRLNTQ